jgi:hypothetical protein
LQVPLRCLKLILLSFDLGHDCGSFSHSRIHCQMDIRAF